MSEKQRTIKDEFSLSGTGLHTGKNVSMTFKPAAPDTGYVFERIDLPGSPKIKAISENVTETTRSTVIGRGNATVSTIEHALSAVYALGIDNIHIEIDGPEVPILNGCASIHHDALLKSQIVEQEAPKRYFRITEKIEYFDPNTGKRITAEPADSIQFEVEVDYNSSVLGKQRATLNDIRQFGTEIAPCKTFVFFKELEFLLKNNQIKGGDLSNALVIVEKDFTQKEFDRVADLFQKEHHVYKGRGILNEQDMTFANEPARHKLLDLIGDISLCGVPLIGKITAEKPGHYVNHEFVEILRKVITN